MNSRTESVSYKNQIAKSNTTARPTQRSFGNFRVWLTRHHRLALSALSVFSVLLLSLIHISEPTRPY